jgi:hypothetical protein
MGHAFAELHTLNSALIELKSTFGFFKSQSPLSPQTFSENSPMTTEKSHPQQESVSLTDEARVREVLSEAVLGRWDVVNKVVRLAAKVLSGRKDLPEASHNSRVWTGCKWRFWYVLLAEEDFAAPRDFERMGTTEPARYGKRYARRVRLAAKVRSGRKDLPEASHIRANRQRIACLAPSGVRSTNKQGLD